MDLNSTNLVDNSTVAELPENPYPEVQGPIDWENFLIFMAGAWAVCAALGIALYFFLKRNKAKFQKASVVFEVDMPTYDNLEKHRHERICEIMPDGLSDNGSTVEWKSFKSHTKLNPPILHGGDENDDNNSNLAVMSKFNFNPDTLITPEQMLQIIEEFQT